MDKQLDSAEIVKGLREYKSLCGGSNAAIMRDWHLQLCDDAADLIESLQAQLDITTANLERLQKRILVKGGTADYPTEDAYLTVCKALEKHREREQAAVKTLEKWKVCGTCKHYKACKKAKPFIAQNYAGCRKWQWCGPGEGETE
jgi:hypothetical protein